MLDRESRVTVALVLFDVLVDADSGDEPRGLDSRQREA
jgi:hypothetical protein